MSCKVGNEVLFLFCFLLFSILVKYVGFFSNLILWNFIISYNFLRKGSCLKLVVFVFLVMLLVWVMKI